MTRTTKRGVFQPQLLAAAVALGVSATANAVDFNIGEIEGKFDSSLTFGSSWATSAPDKQFISNFNSMGVAGGKSSSRTVDDNRLNFKSGENISTIVKGLHDLELKYGDSGAFVRGKYWYDFELKDGHQHFYDIDDSGRDQAAKSSGAMFLDSFVYHNYNLGDLPGNVRLGKQVVSWGESTFIQNGINVINPIDVAAVRRPGSEVKEGLIPENMIYVSQGLADNFTAEAFYQITWEKTITDNCGTFFGSDGVPKGCDDRLVVSGLDLAPGAALNKGGAAAVAGGLDDVYIPRAKDNDPRNSGQFGIALRWFVPELNDTEFGAYALNYHSRNPFLSTIRTSGPGTPPSALNVPRNAKYFIDYPEDIRLYGLSFAANVAGTSLGGELSYRPNMPLQLSTPDLLSATVGTASSPLLTTGFATTTPGGVIDGYDRMPVLQAQMTATKLFNQVWGSDRLTLVGEVGYNRINGLGDSDGTDLRFGRSPAFGSGILPGAAGLATCKGSAVGQPNASNPAQQCNSHGFYTTSSWGYRVRAQLDYPNVFAGVNLSPNLAWSHDVDGWGPNFEEGAKAVSLGLNADYQNTYTAALNYTNFFDGKYNTMTDRDYVSLSLGVNF
ncbi:MULTISPECIES: DUF1302 domain-containing protein [Pseudomonas]|uniref:DUF1302 domain-containing protein n=1 Tax=Pseudomonas nitroreducens TaxID=46680 RepID=UPI001E339FB7|nr:MULTISPECIES: DUF1302 domain-containing protein [Pseudomonas]MCE4070564.1 DUF1302 domain-containing protein [Pseudomonas nitritireducens]MCE4080566.1 DUF1302 domain-containing protein [Pseudomonas nitroreducens]